MCEGKTVFYLFQGEDDLLPSLLESIYDQTISFPY